MGEGLVMQRELCNSFRTPSVTKRIYGLTYCHHRYVSTPVTLDAGEVVQIQQRLQLPPPRGSLGLITKYRIEILRQVICRRN